MECNEQAIQRYYSVLTNYLTMVKHLETCSKEDKEFYQHVSLIFAYKVKAMQDELTDKGFIFCQGNSIPVPCEDAFAEVEKQK